ncbi:DEAD/DEAH box helicase [Sutterella sp.]|uniref:DEAD/DEAH box helicase n=1 Tax=Sutterella sp. TaxID=1981025 RepID=UPI003FD80BCB
MKRLFPEVNQNVYGKLDPLRSAGFADSTWFQGRLQDAWSITPAGFVKAAADAEPGWAAQAPARLNDSEDDDCDEASRLAQRFFISFCAFLHGAPVPPVVPEGVSSAAVKAFFTAERARFLLLALDLSALRPSGETPRDWTALFEALPEVFVKAIVPALEEIALTAPSWNLYTGATEGVDGPEVLGRLRGPLLEGVKERSLHAALHDWFVYQCDFLRKGDPKACLAALKGGTAEAEIIAAVCAMTEDRPSKEAAAHMVQALKLKGSKRLFANPPSNWFYAAALCRDHEALESRKRLAGLLELKQIAEDARLWYLRLPAAAGADGDLKRALKYQDDLFMRGGWIARSFWLVTANYFQPVENRRAQRLDEQFLHLWPVFELAWSAPLDDPERTAALEERFRMKPLMPFFTAKPEWERVLDRLAAEAALRAGRLPKKTAEDEPAVRIAYYVDPKSYEITMKVQKMRAGGWTKGTDLTKAAFQKGVAGMSDADTLVQQTLVHPRGSTSRWVFAPVKALLALVGNPNVYNAVKPDVRLEVVKTPLQLTVVKKKGAFRVSTNLVSGFSLNWSAYSVRTLGDHRIEVIEPDEADRKMLRGLEEVNYAFPAEAEEKLSTYLGTLSRFTPVMSDILKNAEGTDEKRAGDAKITLRITASGEGEYVAKAVVRPIPEAEVVFRPGQGLDFVAAAVKGRTVQVSRDRKAESANFEALTAALEPISGYREDEYTWRLGMADCLELLEAARVLSKTVVVEWPEGAEFVVRQPKLSADSLQLSVKTIGDWLQIKGELKFGPKTQMSFAELLGAVHGAKTGFIRLEGAEYVAVTESLRRQLALFDGFARGEKSGAVGISAFNAPMLEDLEAAGVKLEADAAYEKLVARIHAARNATPAVPAGLRADLRAYQIEGFEWLSRLSSWGAGALLADDMGLGKTLQTIALLIARTDEGPALVVTPTSVLYNWVDELRRFAPVLRPVVVNQVTDRAAAVQTAAGGDVLLVSYGVMAGDSELLKARAWGTIVLDEAHAIKNHETKTARAAMELRGSARVLLTGTPLQNHLSELWTLFEFANPGLLGSRRQFAERFVIPVEKNRDRDRQRVLQRLISPFILRRTKAEVLDELPEKTEITLRVELSADERAVYERIRGEAAKRIGEGEMNPVEALAQLTKLRQAACSLELLGEAQYAGAASSKTAAFLDLVGDLAEGRHRALVFSQFTSHLALIRRALDERGIPYLYLDGATPAGERVKRVAQFQRGDMPLFLISLKAGGTGLNLTAADYVIHLDPWWNPAVEDQASDRAYRIGQENPVTIYRLVAANSIEEQILELHATKKSLADALLEGSDVSARLSREEILALLAES